MNIFSNIQIFALYKCFIHMIPPIHFTWEIFLFIVHMTKNKEQCSPVRSMSLD